MGKELQFGKFSVDSQELEKGEYSCDPILCKGSVCCGVFDIAVTVEERLRITELLGELEELCPWLKDYTNAFKVTPCEIFIKKREDGLCLFNWEDQEGRAWCALHTLALKKGQNPFRVKPLNCSLWPFLRDGNNHLELDTHTDAPCLKFDLKKKTPNEELLAMLEALCEDEEE